MNTKLFIISGASGSGQDSVIEGLANYFPIERVITTTTREARPGECDGHPYYFVTKEAFREKISAGAFVEYAEHYNGNLYGVTHEELNRVRNSGKIGILKIEYQGVETVKKLFPDIVAILITAPLDILEARIRRRDNPSEKFITERMTYTREMLRHQNLYDYTVENEEGKLDHTIRQVADIIRRHVKLT